jgi:hypothetical protein
MYNFVISLPDLCMGNVNVRHKFACVTSETARTCVNQNRAAAMIFSESIKYKESMIPDLVWSFLENAAGNVMNQNSCIVLM